MMRAGFNPPEGWEAIFRRVIALTSPSIGLCQKIDVTGLKFGEAAKDFRCKRGNMNHSIGFGAQNYNGKRERPGLVVLRKLFIHRQKHIKFGGVGDEAKELAVADAGPTGLGNSSDAVGRKLKGQILRKAFVEQEAHSGGGEEALAGSFEKGHGLRARDGGILLQKLAECLAAFDVVQQRPHGNTSAGKARLATHDLRIHHHDGALFHGNN